MSAFQFRFDRHRLHALLTPRKPRNPLLRVALGLLGLAVLALLVFVSVFVGAAMIAAGLVLRLWQSRGKPMARDRTPARVVDAEYRVIGRSSLSAGR